MSDITTKLLSHIEDSDPKAFGQLQVQKIGDTYFISGELYTSLEDIESIFQDAVEAIDPKGVSLSTVKTSKSGITLTEVKNSSSKTSWKKAKAGVLDEIAPLHLGFIDRKLLNPHPSYKRMNFETFEKIKRIVKVLDVVSPIITDRNFQVIDGNLRLEVSEVLEKKTVPVLVLDCEGEKADFLRLVLNRSSEFQRWIYQDVDKFVDSLPQAQPLLEPLGFFSNNILPVTFFGNTVLNYTIDEYNEQMKMYSQDIGLAEWAKMRKEEILAEEEEKKQKKATNPSTDGRVSLFDLMVTEDDFIPTSDPKKVVADHVEEMKVVAGIITEAYDEKRRAEKEATGQAWQTSRRTSKKKAADKRAEAEALLDDVLDSEVMGTEDE